MVDVPLATGNPSNRLAAACETPDQAVWLHFADGSLWRYLNGGTNWFSDGTVQPTDYRSVALEQDGPLWIATDQQLLAVDWKAVGQGSALPLLQTVTPGAQFLLPSRTGGCWRLNGRVQKWRANQDRPELDFGWYPWGYGLVTVRLTTACEDLDGNLIVGTRGGGLYWFTSEGEVTHISTEENGLSNNYILSLHVDRQGDVWVGTDGGGLNRIKKPLFRVLEPSQDRVVQSIAEDSAGGLWLGYNGLPLTYWKDGQAQTFPSEARTAFVDRQQRVWVGTHGAGLLQVQADARRQLKLRPVPGYPSSLSSVTAIHQDRAGQLWVGTQTGLARWDETSWTTYTTREGLPANVVQAIADDAEGNTWLGFDSGGLCQWRHGQVLATFRKSADGLPSDNVSSLYADSDGVLWVATDGGGLARWQRGQWTRYTRNEGLASNSIGYVLEDHQGYLWIGSNAGLMRASKNALNDFAAGRTNSFGCRVYGKPDGLPVRECSSGTQPGPCRARDGSLWFPTIKGVAVVDPAQLKPNLNPPPVRIEAVLIDGRPQSGNTLRSRLPDFIVVPAGNEHIEVQYSSLSFAAPERARYRYRLEGYQNDWTEAGSATVAHYHRLPPADYRFRVIACNEDGVWNQVGATLGLVILPPFGAHGGL
ncbi:MAG: two-component regulator propeller domain-containing protein [Verrucomicrobiota bacterium]